MKKLQLNSLYIIIFFIIITLGCKPNQANKEGSLVSYIESKATELNTSSELDEIINNAADKRLMLLGEASHGTHEYYTWRDSISRRLIKEEGFSFIAVEGDWASLYELNRYVKNLEDAPGSAKEILQNFERWPTWLWGNEEVLALIEWLREYNKNLDFDDKVGFYGMDVYDEWNSIYSLYNFLEKHDEELLENVKELYSCFEQYDGDTRQYAHSINRGASDCAEELKAVVDLIKKSRDNFEKLSDYEYFYGKQNAYVVKYAEKFYRYSVQSRGPESWNRRVDHMNQTVQRLLDLYGDDSQGIVWAHNTHVGDARATEMSNHGRVNIGQLSRETFGHDKVFITGFGTYTGTVKAGSGWESQMQKMEVPKAHEDSFEYTLNNVKYNNFVLVFDEDSRKHEEFNKPKGHRAIGVVYNPRREVPGNYVATILPQRYDAFIFFKNTKALNPL